MKLIYELDQTLHSILNDSELALQDGDGSGPFREDDYFQADDVQYPDDHIISLDLTEIRQEQESIVIRHLADGGFSPVEWESLQARRERRRDVIVRRYCRHYRPTRRFSKTCFGPTR